MNSLQCFATTSGLQSDQEPFCSQQGSPTCSQQQQCWIYTCSAISQSYTLPGWTAEAALLCKRQRYILCNPFMHHSTTSYDSQANIKYSYWEKWAATSNLEGLVWRYTSWVFCLIGWIECWRQNQPEKPRVGRPWAWLCVQSNIYPWPMLLHPPCNHFWWFHCPWYLQGFSEQGSLHAILNEEPVCRDVDHLILTCTYA